MQVLQKETYLTMIKGAVGSKLFQTLWVQDENKVRDVLEKGDLSCAFFVSSILHHFNLIDTPHATVASTLVGMRQNGWEETDMLVPGSVIVWEKQKQVGNEAHNHIGFYIDDDVAISNSYKECVPVAHDTTFGGSRAIESRYTHTFLNS